MDGSTPRYSRRSLLGAAGAVATAKPVMAQTTPEQSTVKGNWRGVFGDTQNTGTAAVETPTSLDIAWKYTAGSEISGYPVQFGDTVYLPVGSEIVAFDTAQKTEQWRANIGDRGTFGLAATGDTVVAGTTNTDGTGSVRAFERNDGSTRWMSSTESSLQCAPTIDSDTVYIGDEGGTVTAMDLATGVSRWTDTGESIRGGPLALTDSSLFAQSRTGTIRAVDRSDGTRNWSAELGIEGFGTPVVGSEGLYVGGFQAEGSSVVSLNLETGDRRWERSINGTVAFPGALGDESFIVQNGRRLLALDQTDGRTVWEAPVAGGGPVVVTETAVYALTPTALYTQSIADGSDLGEFTSSTELQWLPIPHQKGLFVATENGKLLSLQAPPNLDRGLLALGGGGLLTAIVLGYRYLANTRE